MAKAIYSDSDFEAIRKHLRPRGATSLLSTKDYWKEQIEGTAKHYTGRGGRPLRIDQKEALEQTIKKMQQARKHLMGIIKGRSAASGWLMDIENQEAVVDIVNGAEVVEAKARGALDEILRDGPGRPKGTADKPDRKAFLKRLIFVYMTENTTKFKNRTYDPLKQKRLTRLYKFLAACIKPIDPDFYSNREALRKEVRRITGKAN